jgi:hypothetical protein
VVSLSFHRRVLGERDLLRLLAGSALQAWVQSPKDEVPRVIVTTYTAETSVNNNLPEPLALTYDNHEFRLI